MQLKDMFIDRVKTGQLIICKSFTMDISTVVCINLLFALRHIGISWHPKTLDANKGPNVNKSEHLWNSTLCQDSDCDKMCSFLSWTTFF